MAYFDLARSFGDVPLLLSPITSPSDSALFPSRVDGAKIYQQVITDLKYAEANCFTEPNIWVANKGMVSSGAASAMLARVYLQRASGKYADPADNQAALDECNKIITSNTYSLMPVYSDVFNWDKKFYPTQKEVIFGVQFGSNGSSVTQNITCRMFSPSGLGGSGSFLAQPQIFPNRYPPHHPTPPHLNLSQKPQPPTMPPLI